MAKAAAPFVHSRLSSVEANVKAQLSHEERLRELEKWFLTGKLGATGAPVVLQ
jgi:hypothetical protein